MEKACWKINACVRAVKLKWMTVHAALLAILLAMFAVSEAGSVSTCICNELDRSASTWRLHLVAKNPATWQQLEEGASGELTIQRSSGKFELKASGLRPNTEYALVRYDGKPPFGNVLARGFSDAHGEYTGAGIWQQWSKKFWLVLGKDLKGRYEDFKPGVKDELKAWHPAEYLFETEEL